MDDSTSHDEGEVAVREANEGPTDDHEKTWGKNDLLAANCSGKVAGQNWPDHLADVDHASWKVAQNEDGIFSTEKSATAATT